MSFDGREPKAGIPSAWGKQRGGLTPGSSFTVDYLPVPTHLSDYITTMYWFRCEDSEISDIQPASIGHLSLFAKGEGTIYFGEGRSEPSHRMNLLTPLSIAAPFEVQGPFHAIGAALTPLGWAGLTGLHAAQHSNRIYRAEETLGGEIGRLGEIWSEGYRSGALSAQDVAAALADYIGANSKTVPAKHRDLIAATNRWLAADLDPDLDDLYDSLGYSRRQVQRVLEQYFGLPPVALKRKYRALRAAALLSLPELAPDFERKVRGAFFDQPHMIREISLFVGRTPARLTDDASPFLSEMLDTQNFREIGGLPKNDGDTDI